MWHLRILRQECRSNVADQHPVPNSVVTFAISSILLFLLLLTPCFIPGGKEGTRLIINYLPALPRKAIAITSRSRGQRDQPASGFALFLPSSLPPLPPSLTRRFISYVHTDEEQCENWGSVSPGCWHSSYSRDGTHLGTTRRSASRSGADWSLRETRRYD